MTRMTRLENGDVETDVFRDRNGVVACEVGVGEGDVYKCQYVS